MKYDNDYQFYFLIALLFSPLFFRFLGWKTQLRFEDSVIAYNSGTTTNYEGEISLFYTLTTQIFSRQEDFMTYNYIHDFCAYQ